MSDCWPVASWASLDYSGRWKALHYAARRFYAPVLLSEEEDGSRVALYVSSDPTGEWRGTVRWSLETLAGEALRSGGEAVMPPALGTAQVCVLDFSDHLTAGPAITVSANIRRDLVLVYELWQGPGWLSIGALPFVPGKHLELEAPDLGTVVRRTGASFEVRVTAKRLARFVRWNWMEPTRSSPTTLTCRRIAQCR